MAEPLLKKTFSRLRGKDRLKRKKSDVKERDRPTKTSDVDVSSSNVDSKQTAAADPEDVCQRGPSITVAKKQNWARFSSITREPRTSFSRKHPFCLQAPANVQNNQSTMCGQKPETRMECSRPDILSPCPLKNSTEFLSSSVVQACGQEVLRIEESTSGACSPTPIMKFTGHAGMDENARLSFSYQEMCNSSSIKYSGHGAYLQSLERSSREWVLSSPKGQGLEEGLTMTLTSVGELQESIIMSSEGDIWYNPIPEDEDLSTMLDKTDSWKKWGMVPKEGDLLKTRNSEATPGHDTTKRANPDAVTSSSSSSSALSVFSNVSHTVNGGPEGSCLKRLHEPVVVVTGASPPRSPGEEDLLQKSEVLDKVSNVVLASPDLESAKYPTPTESPQGSKKLSNAINKMKSPGTVRRLSMKMKKLPELRRKLSLRTTRNSRPDADGSSPKESSNVISRYHLDTSVATRETMRRNKAGQASKAVSKGGYLSDGDSPELIAKTDKRSSGGPQEEKGCELDVGAFRPYSISEHPRCVQHLSGLVSVHLYGVQDVKSTKAESRDIFCALQVDGINRARTALLTCRTAFLSLNHTFNLELEGAQLLKLVIFSWDPVAGKNRVCCHGSVSLPHIFKGSRTQLLAVRLEPRGLLYSKLTLVEQWDAAPSGGEREPQVFGVELRRLVEREKAVVRVPLLIQKCVAEIEKRGLKVVGLYRLCGSAAVKKELRDAFERDSSAVTLSEDLYPDINVVTGILKDYLRELPTPLITKTLYEVVLQAMSRRHPKGMGLELEAWFMEETLGLLNCLPEIEKATLTMLLNHLSVVASYRDYNRMNAQNIAVCFGPVLLAQNQDPMRQGSRSYAHCGEIASAVDFKRHIEVLHYLLQVWPNPRRKVHDFRDKTSTKPTDYLRQKTQLKLDLFPSEVVSRNRCRGLESPPSNRYAGDWSVCGQDFLLVPSSNLVDVDYDEVAGTDSENEEENQVLDLRENFLTQTGTVFVGDFALVDDSEEIDLETPFSPRLNLKDFDALILDLERELSKQINICL
ncbi:rho GTPase-activating protein SYDE1 [Ambystoma mexicanum]|uniref:rho GTPase-activating protein SYDE1 n=1 Tax=Ambystoma mexicanum TaxID=8296 RepID=UPI0037E8A3E3